MTTLQTLADTRKATPGRCCVRGCTQHACVWSRSGRRATDADGLTLAVRACSEHETAADKALSQLTLADVVNLVPRSQRKNKARTARARADKILGHGRRSASARAQTFEGPAVPHTPTPSSGNTGD
jgi:hypothetical protein